MNIARTTSTELPRHFQNPDDTTVSLHNLVTRVNHFIPLLNNHFFNGEQLPELTLTIERLRINTLGEYRIVPTGFGDCHQIMINRRHLDIPFYQHLAVILHQMTHCWEKNNYLNRQEGQQPWYHTIRFRQKMLQFGIVSDQNGTDHGFGPECAFAEFLKTHAVSCNNPTISKNRQFIPLAAPNKAGFSKLKKYSCDCTNVRVATPGFQAVCLNCNQKFHSEQS